MNSGKTVATRPTGFFVPTAPNSHKGWPMAPAGCLPSSRPKDRRRWSRKKTRKPAPPWWMNRPRHWPPDPHRRPAPRLQPGRFVARSQTMPTTNATSRPRMAAIYAPSTVRARRWLGAGDVRGYRPPSGWTARADLTDIYPITGRALARGGSSRRRNSRHQHRVQACPPWTRWMQKSGCGGGRARCRGPTAHTTPQPSRDSAFWGDSGRETDIFPMRRTARLRSSSSPPAAVFAQRSGGDSSNSRSARLPPW
ncbi:hypothetical protein HMPREF9702_02555 [Delftia acidovorans CCUG 15835]|nr:hypothetical protein HMPREF9702_02555 [Delftia acidovorans CCUG 15835]